eukprot:TRINITY_DN3465_c0_g1_i1.p1 TRINITY_DN3465_c0_g1~~TRINITY_DN3465_c0_g1_i1.p1  ORF type:complete len:422 (-),score=134.95 TRINITY_DN3465_c0_g1_i1:69-1310(-)
MNTHLFLVLISTFLFGICCLDNGLGLTPPMGWTTWCTDNGLIPCENDFCNETEIKSIALAMVNNGMQKLGYEYINLDDCWAGPRLANGTITADKSRFPSGDLKELANFLHELGLKLGLYTDVGENTCRGKRPGSWPYYQLDADTYASWGIDYVKMDWCDHPGGYSAQQLYTNMSQALNSTGRPMFFALCEWGLYDVWEWAGDVGNSWRVGPDHIPVWWSPKTNQDPGQGQGTANIIQHMAGLGNYTGPGGWNNPDFLMIGEFTEGFDEFSEIDYETEFSFWCLFAAPLIVATDIRNLDNKQQILNEKAIKVNQDSLGKGGDRYYKNDHQELWSKPLSDNSFAVIAYNSNLNPFGFSTTITIKFNDIPSWPENMNSAIITDIWSDENYGTVSNEFESKKIRPHGVQMLIITPTN